MGGGGGRSGERQKDLGGEVWSPPTNLDMNC